MRDGAEAAKGVVDLASCAVVALVVPDDSAVEDVLVGPGDLLARLAPGSVVLLHSTVLPRTAVAMHAQAGERGVAVVDAPVSGGPERAARGDLSVMVGGDADAVARVDGVLRSIGSDVTHVGRAGAGAAVKLANQLMMFSALAGAQEALDLAESFGVEETDALRAVRSGLGDSWVARNWRFFDRMVAEYDEGGTPVSQRPWSKDLWDVVATAREQDLRLPVAGLLAQIMADRVEERAHR